MQHFFPFLLSSEDKKIENSITIGGNSSYGIRNALYLNQDKQV